MKKKAEDLKRGDVITDFLRAASFLGNAVVVNSYGCGGVNVCDVAGNVSRIMLGYDTTVEVESPSLTPAQQHAEELLQLVRQSLSLDDEDGKPDTPWNRQARTLLARIDPPKPPSVEELAEALYEVMKRQDNTPEALDVLSRARAAGYLGKDAQ